MNELRWVKRIVPAPGFGPDVGQEKLVLQYGVMVKAVDKNGAVSAGTFWQDVPTVEEETP